MAEAGVDNWLERLEFTMERERKRIKARELALFCKDMGKQAAHIYILQQLSKRAQEGSSKARNALLDLSGRPWENQRVQHDI